eukprot:tig00021178_g19206.t1
MRGDPAPAAAEPRLEERGGVARSAAAPALLSLHLRLWGTTSEVAWGLADALGALHALSDAQLDLDFWEQDDAPLAGLVAAGRPSLKTIALAASHPPSAALSAALVALPPPCAIVLNPRHAPLDGLMRPYGALAPLLGRLRVEGEVGVLLYSYSSLSFLRPAA